MKVYIIEQGEYSDYRVVGIYSTRENAEKICEMINLSSDWDKAAVEERDLDPYIDLINEGLIFYFVRVNKEGHIFDTELANPTIYNPDKFFFDNENNLCAHVWAKDESELFKIMSEYRSSILANGCIWMDTCKKSSKNLKDYKNV